MCDSSPRFLTVIGDLHAPINETSHEHLELGLTGACHRDHVAFLHLGIVLGKELLGVHA